MLCVLILSLTICGMLLSKSGKLCLRHFFARSECHVCVRHSLGLISNFENKLARYNESNCNTIVIVVI